MPRSFGIVEGMLVFGAADATFARLEPCDRFRGRPGALQFNRHGSFTGVRDTCIGHDKAKLLARCYFEGSAGRHRSQFGARPSVGVVIKIPSRDALDAAEPFFFFGGNVLESLARPAQRCTPGHIA